MTIWVDADSCPKRVRDIVIRAANKRAVRARFVSKQDAGVSTAGEVESIVTDGDPDEIIVSEAEAGDLVVTRDIPLAARLVEQEVGVLNTRGDVYDHDNVRERLSERDFMFEFRSSAAFSEPGRRHGAKEVAKFANAFDRELAKRLKQ
ncbi:MAG: YaiI/YqxD family protein [Spirochaetota bacterium]